MCSIQYQQLVGVHARMSLTVILVYEQRSLYSQAQYSEIPSSLFIRHMYASTN